MQVFLPYPSFIDSILCLDYKRLGKQRVEAFQILNILLDRTNKKGYRNHPVVKMWKGYEKALSIYYNLCLIVWEEKGYVNNMKYEPPAGIVKIPWWIGLEEFHNSHKSNLLRKDFNFYKRYNWNIPDNLKYIYPLKKEIIK